MTAATLKRYLALPLKSAPLMLIIIVSLLLSFASRAGLMGLPLTLILMSWFFKYAFVLLDHTTDGVDEPPVLSLEMVNPVSEQRSLVLLIIVVAIFFSSNAASYWFGPALGTLLAIAIVFILPAIIGIQGATGSLLQSLNLSRCVRLIGTLGRDYALIVVCAGVLLSVAFVLSRMPSLPLIIRLAFAMYAWLALFAVIGGVLFERRLDIGLDAAYSPERVDAKNAADVEHERNRLVDRIYAEWRGGSHVTACITVTELLRQSTAPSDELEWLYAKTSHWPDARLPSQLAQAWLPYLLAAKRNGRVLEVLKERLAADPSFRPATSQQVLRCVRLARDGGERNIARKLLEDFAERYPNDTLQVAAEDLRSQLER
ncbi:MAG TPA: hypothetical protein VNA21_07480 [Steroidobacteraceae bacterium]|nr:hypothetical protein [Steroidobacteraceae bacterium]